VEIIYTAVALTLIVKLVCGWLDRRDARQMHQAMKKAFNQEDL
jgi:hypothetical protein